MAPVFLIAGRYHWYFRTALVARDTTLKYFAPRDAGADVPAGPDCTTPTLARR